MKTIDNLSEIEILSIKLEKPESIFMADSEVKLKAIYRKMSALWHPDKHITDNRDTAKVFVHIKSLYESALKKLEDGTLGQGLSIKFKTKDSKEFLVKYQIVKDFELGKVYITNDFVVWCFLPEYKKNAQEGLERIRKLKFADDKMKKEFSKYVPEISQTLETNEYFIIVMKKDKGFINLRDIFDHYGKMEPKHMAWVISTMYNLACFLKYNQIMHGGITLDNYFVNPENHEGYVLGGWWYSKVLGDKLEMLSEVAIDVAPVSLINTKQAQEGLDLEMIKLAGRIMLGDATGVYLNKNTALPKRLVSWLRDASMGNSFKDYGIWMNDVLKESFGVRRFIKMDLKANDIYKGE